MAQMKSLIDELDIINEKLEKMKGLLAEALEGFVELQKRAAEHRNEAEGEQTCPACLGRRKIYLRRRWVTCPQCKGTGHV
jgi:hypothetical protein